jgi:hypothetical protein
VLFVWERVKDGLDVIAIVFLAQLVIVVVLAFQDTVKVLFHNDTAVEGIPHSGRHLLIRHSCGFVLAAQVRSAPKTNE